MWSDTAKVSSADAHAGVNTKALEGLRAGHLVQKMTIDIEGRLSVGQLIHYVGGPHLVEQRSRGGQLWRRL